MKKKSKITSLLVLFSINLFFLFFNSCEVNPGVNVYSNLSGAYSCQESSPYSGYRKYIIEIDKVNSQDDLYIISNFHNQGTGEFIYANYRNDSICIENQNITGLFISGKGKVNESFNNIQFNYVTNDGNIELKFFALYSR